MNELEKSGKYDTLLHIDHYITLYHTVHFVTYRSLLYFTICFPLWKHDSTFATDENSWYKGDNKSAITRISSLQVFYYTEQLCNSKI
jgi:hypothetical protein